MTVWRPTSASQEPQTKLYSWQVYEVAHASGVTRHFAGYCGEGRVSSPIQEWVGEQNYGITRSGRRYLLCGESRYNKHAEYVFGVWLGLHNLTYDDVKNVSDEYEGLDESLEIRSDYHVDLSEEISDKLDDNF